MIQDLSKMLQILNIKIVQICVYMYNAYCKHYNNKNYVYEIKECHRNKDGQQVVIAKIINSPKSVFSIPVIELVVKRKDILSGFNIDDIVSIVSLATIQGEPMIVYNKPISYKFFSIISMLFGAMLIISNIAASKLILVFGITMTGGALCYPLTYMLGNVITEVYGYKRVRQLIWGAVLCNVLLIFFIQLTIVMESSPYWHNQKELVIILGAVPRIILASLVSYWCGEFVNSYIMVSTDNYNYRRTTTIITDFSAKKYSRYFTFSTSFCTSFFNNCAAAF